MSAFEMTDSYIHPASWLWVLVIWSKKYRLFWL